MADSSSVDEGMKGLTDPDMEAAQHLMQLSGDDAESSSREDKDQSQGDISSGVTEEIVPKSVAVRLRKRRFRSIASIYMETRPLGAMRVKKLRY